MTIRGWLLRASYGAIFVAGVPTLLVWWAHATEGVVPLRAIHSAPAGVALGLASLALVAAGARALMLHGRGLPMNAFPPPRFVREGVYRWIRNPMYIGFGLACAGIAIATGSASGLWLVTPIAALAATALVFGFERPDLLRRFGPDALRPPLLSLPRGTDDAPAIVQRAAVVVWVLIPWLGTWFAAQAIGRAPDVFETALSFERTWPVWQWTELLYVTAYIFIPLTVVVATSGRSLRRFAVSGSIATVIVSLCWLTIPVVAANRAFVPATAVGRLLAFEQGHSVGVAAFPAFHVLWAMLAATAWPNRWIGWMWALAITLSCLTTGMHTLIEVGAAMLLYLPLRDPSATWGWIRARTEALANSWREWRIGPIRVINHGAYAAAAASAGFVVLALALPEGATTAAWWMLICVVAGAGVWAQVLEGSSTLLRPFGWYGGAIGGAIGAAAAPWFGVPITTMLAGLALAAPWIQALGRLRCLVQGCCHGGPATALVGIRYHHRRSRVTQIAHLDHQPLHPTPLYSIAGNLVIAAILLRLRFLGAPNVLVIGVYLMLGGLARFVEEGYRAEPQTPVIAGLHSYQWIAMASVLAGIWCTTLPIPAAPAGFTPFSWPIAAGAAAAGVLTGVAMGIDLPRSNRRFSRLARAD